MSTQAIREALAMIRRAGLTPQTAAESEVEAIEKAQATLRLVFEVGALNPYQTSDFSPEYALREWCGWTPNDDD